MFLQEPETHNEGRVCFFVRDRLPGSSSKHIDHNLVSLRIFLHITPESFSFALLMIPCIPFTALPINNLKPVRN